MTLSLEDVMTNGVVLLDGGIGIELRKRAPGDDRSLLPALILLERPDIVAAVHEDYLRAGSRVITTNTYASVRARLDEAAGLGDRLPDLLRTAAQAAAHARERVGAPALIAGSLPPLHGSYRPDLVQAYDLMHDTYCEHVDHLASGVDVFLCETMSTGEEAHAAASAAAASGKPVWVSWTLEDRGSARLRSGESLTDAWRALDGVAVDAALVNCCWPESVGAAMAGLAALGAARVGGYGNGFGAIDQGWTLDDGIAALGQRREIGPEAYADHVDDWIGKGATIVGGCCEIGPAHIAELDRRLRGRRPQRGGEGRRT